MKHKKSMALLCAVLVCLLGCLQASALTGGQDMPFSTYSYSKEGGLLKDAAAYVPYKTLQGRDLGLENLNKPTDLFLDTTEQRLYIADTGNNRIVSCSLDFADVSVIDSFATEEGQEGFKAPGGVYKRDGLLYVADTENNRVVSLDGQNRLVKSYGRPESPQFSQTVEYKPLKVAVSSQGDIYIISDGIFEGIINIDTEGVFQGYAGMNLVKPSPWDLFWRAVSTKKQRESMAAFLPVTFFNFDLDGEGFLLATSQLENNGGSALKRLNPGGNDVMRTIDGPITGDKGDLYSGKNTGNTAFSDVCSIGSGMIACTDRVRGRVFLYSGDGRLMFAFGGTGEQYGCLTGPSAIDSDGYDLYVLDAVQNSINIYTPTDYGKSLLLGEEHFTVGDYDASEASYQAAFQHNSNCEAAYLGIGKAQLLRGETAAAMKSFMLSGHQDYYGKALQKHIKNLADDYFIPLACGFVFLILLFVFRKPIGRLFTGKSGKKPKEKGRMAAWLGTLWEALEFSFYPTLHPFKGFYEMKYEKRGRMRSAVFILAVFALVTVLEQMFTGYSFSATRPEDVNILMGLGAAVAPVLLFALANWCVTALMDGEGSFAYILMSTVYALIPVILVKALMIPVSQIMGPDTAVLYYTVQTMAWIFMAFLVFVGNMTVHNYTLGKTVATVILTFVGMAIIVFLCLLIFNLFIEIRDFVFQLYREIIFRV